MRKIHLRIAAAEEREPDSAEELLLRRYLIASSPLFAAVVTRRCRARIAQDAKSLRVAHAMSLMSILMPMFPLPFPCRGHRNVCCRARFPRRLGRCECSDARRPGCCLVHEGKSCGQHVQSRRSRSGRIGQTECRGRPKKLTRRQVGSGNLEYRVRQRRPRLLLLPNVPGLIYGPSSLRIERIASCSLCLAAGLSFGRSLHAEPSRLPPEIGYDYSELETARTAAMGGALRAFSNSLEALQDNPANLAATRVYHMGGMAQFWTGANRQSY